MEKITSPSKAIRGHTSLNDKLDGKAEPMTLPKNLLAKYLQHFNVLISEGEAVFKSFGWYGNGNWVCGDNARLCKWETQILTLLEPFTKEGTRLKEQVDLLTPLGKGKDEVESCVAVLKALRDDLEQGFLDNLLLRVEAEVGADYMGQAEGLLNEGQPGKFDHVAP